nr:YkgJ family cysteine cluster protein [Helicobacter sp. MIT 01-3238]
MIDFGEDKMTSQSSDSNAKNVGEVREFDFGKAQDFGKNFVKAKSCSQTKIATKDFSFEFVPSACKECGGKCCVGESGYIFLSLSQAEAIADFLHLSLEDFARKYLIKVGYRFSLIEKRYENGFACVFFDEVKKSCQIYPLRPKQCVDFPFWDKMRGKKCEDLGELFALCRGVRNPANSVDSLIDTKDCAMK